MSAGIQTQLLILHSKNFTISPAFHLLVSINAELSELCSLCTVPSSSVKDKAEHLVVDSVRISG